MPEGIKITRTIKPASVPYATKSTPFEKSHFLYPFGSRSPLRLYAKISHPICIGLNLSRIEFVHIRFLKYFLE